MQMCGGNIFEFDKNVIYFGVLSTDFLCTCRRHAKLEVGLSGKIVKLEGLSFYFDTDTV